MKDNIDTIDSPTTCGSPALLGHTSKFNSTIWEVLSNSGGLNSGKTNMNEFAYGVTTNNAYYG